MISIVAAHEIQDGPDALREWLARGYKDHPDKPYLVSVEDNRILTYGDLHRTAERIGGHLAARGIGRGGRVALLANNSLEHLAIYLSVLAHGATICTVHVEMNRRHFDAVIPALAPQLVLYQEGLGLEPLSVGKEAYWLPLGRWSADHGKGFFQILEQAAILPAAVTGSPTDDAVICFTSGTTAHPKGVLLTYREMLGNAAAMAKCLGMGPDDRVYDYRSFNWASAQLLGALGTLSSGATLLLSGKFSRSRFVSDLREYRATIAAGNPTVINMLLQGSDGVDHATLPDLRFITSSSAPLMLEQWRQFEDRFGITVAQCYGCSETGWITGCNEKNRRLGTVGKPLPHQHLTIVDREGRVLPQGETGYVEVGCFDDNSYRYIGEDGQIRVNSVGRTRTGDKGYLDADDYLHLTGRDKDLIIRGGVNISPLEIDDILMQAPGVAEAATVGIPDRIYGEEVVSFVVLRSGAQLTAQDILAYCAEHIPTFKSPKQIILREKLPKTERGKLDRVALVRDWLS